LQEVPENYFDEYAGETLATTLKLRFRLDPDYPPRYFAGFTGV
jgi:hypothetical protein